MHAAQMETQQLQNPRAQHQKPQQLNQPMGNVQTKIMHGGETITVMTSWILKDVDMMAEIAAKQIQKKDGINIAMYAYLLNTVT